jgi:hypothetical protein
MKTPGQQEEDTMELAVAPGASAQDTLLAYTGRDPSGG